MKTVAVVSTLAAVVVAGPSLAQTEYRNQPREAPAGSLSATGAIDRAPVISVTPVVQQVAVPHRVCSDEPVAVGRQPSGAGALLGAIAGGAIGNAIGAGTGRAAATALGLFGGAVVGSHIEGGDPGPSQGVRRCTTEHSYEERAVAYNVVYEYAGRQFTTQMRQDPGRYVQVQVQAAPVGEMAPQQQYAPSAPLRNEAPLSSRRPAPVYVERPVYQSPPPVYETYPVAPAPMYYEPSYAPLGAGLVLGALIGYGVYHGHHGYYRHPGWRGGRRR